MSGGIEIGSWAGADQFDPRSILDLARGSFDGGTLGPLLQDIFLNEGADFEYVGEERTDASTLLEYRFQIPESTSHYFIRTGGDRSGGLAYQGSIWIDAESFDLRRLQVRVDGLPPEAHTCLVTTTADYQRTRIGNGDFLVPRESVLRMLMTDSSVTDTTLAYSACREYQSESTINFGAEATPGVTESKASSGATAQLPAGLAFSIVLSNRHRQRSGGRCCGGNDQEDRRKSGIQGCSDTGRGYRTGPHRSNGRCPRFPLLDCNSARNTRVRRSASAAVLQAR